MKYTNDDLKLLLDLAETDTQRAHVKAVITHGSNRKAAKELGLHPTAVDYTIQRVVRIAVGRGWAPEYDMTHVVPPGYKVKGTSTLYDKDGNKAIQWVKTSEDGNARHALLIQSMEGMLDGFKRSSKPIPAPKHTSSNLMAAYPMGDPHFGMYAWGDESGDDFDSEIAERDLCAAIDRLVLSAPACDEAAIINLGDFFHSDNSQNRTMRSGNALDVDTRWLKVLSVGMRAMRYCIDVALRHHKRVRVFNLPGNHDEHSSALLSLALAALYEKDKRVQVDMSPSYFKYFRFGKCLIGLAHGDTCKIDALGGVMAADKAEDWGKTLHRYWYTGHVHHKQVVEMPGVVVESFRTLAAKDSWHAAQGYRSGRDMQCLVLHEDHGEVERHRVDISQLRTSK